MEQQNVEDFNAPQFLGQPQPGCSKDEDEDDDVVFLEEIILPSDSSDVEEEEAEDSDSDRSSPCQEAHEAEADDGSMDCFESQIQHNMANCDGEMSPSCASTTPDDSGTRTEYNGDNEEKLYELIAEVIGIGHNSELSVAEGEESSSEEEENDDECDSEASKESDESIAIPETWNPTKLMKQNDDDDSDFSDDCTACSCSDDEEDLVPRMVQESHGNTIGWSHFQTHLKVQANLLSRIDTDLRSLGEYFPGGTKIMPDNPKSMLLNSILKTRYTCLKFFALLQGVSTLHVEGIPPSENISNNLNRSTASSSKPSDGSGGVLTLCAYFRLMHAVRQRLRKRAHRVCRRILHIIRYRILRILRYRMVLKADPDKEEEFDDRLMLNIRIQLDDGPGPDDEEINTEKFLQYWDEIRAVPFLYGLDHQAIMADHKNIGPGGFRRQFSLCLLLDAILSEEQEYAHDLSDADSVIDALNPDPYTMEVEC